MDAMKAVLEKAARYRRVKFSEVAKSYGIQWSDYPESRKALPGRVRQAVFPLPKGSWSSKTIPLDKDGQVQEHTKIQNVRPGNLWAQSWSESTVRSKLLSILFVPVVKPEKALPGDWYFETPFLWKPPATIESQMEQDYNAVRRLVRARRPSEISIHEPPVGQGKYLVANTAGRNKKDLVDWGNGERLMERRRAWMLRKTFTQTLVDSNIQDG